MLASDLDLLDRWTRDRDAAALDQLVDRNRSWLRAFVRKRMSTEVRGFDSSDDVVQEAAVRVLACKLAYRPRDLDQFRALLATLALNVVRERARRARAARRNRRWEERIDAHPSRNDPAESSRQRPDRRAAAAEEAGCVTTALGLLDPADQDVIELRDFSGLAFDDVGAQLGISAKAATKRHERAVRRLGDVVRQLQRGDLGHLVESTRAYFPEQPQGRG